jgi:site-specific recombinase XerD
MPQVFSHGLVADYYEFTHREGVNEKTALRRVATVRKFFVFCVKQQWLTHNPVTSHESLEEKQEKMSLINTYLSSLKQTNKSRDLDYQNKLISEFLNY